MRMWLFIIPIICFMEPEHLQVILSGTRTEKNFFYTILGSFLGGGLLTTKGIVWKTHRKLIQPYFHIRMLSQFINTFSEGGNILVDRLRSEDVVNIAPLMNECVLRILHYGILGIPMENFDFNSPFTHYSINIFERIRKPWLLIEPLFSLTSLSNDQYKNQDDIIYSYTKEILQRRITELRNGAPRKMSLMDFFIKISEEHPNFTNDDIINEITTFMSAGQESVATTMTFTLYYLAKHQDVQEKVMDEQRSINFDEGEMTLDTTKQMAYLKQCINETLRLYPAAPLLARITTEDVTVGEITVPRGTHLFISPCSTHRLEHIYPDPEKFDPERFSADNMKKLHPYAFIPFSVGPRNCIGYKFAYLEMISILSTVLRNYHVSLVPGKENLTVYFRITPRAKGGVWLKLTPRKP